MRGLRGIRGVLGRAGGSSAGRHGGVDPLDFSPYLVLDASAGVENSAAAAEWAEEVDKWENQVAAVSKLSLPGTAGNRITVPSAPEFTGLDDFTMQVDDITLPDWSLGVNQAFIAKYDTTGDNREFLFRISGTGQVQFYWYTAGTSTPVGIITGATLTLKDSQTASFRIVKNGTDFRFFTDTGDGFAQFGVTKTITDAACYSGTAPLEFGTTDLGAGFVGTMGRVRIWDTPDHESGAPVFDLDFSSYSPGDTSLVTASGHTATINTSGSPAAEILSVASADPAEQATAANQPVYLPHTRDNYLHLPGVASNYASVPDAANLDGFGDFTVQVDDMTTLDWTPAATVALLAKNDTSTNNRSWALLLDPSGRIGLSISPTGLPAGSYFSNVSITTVVSSGGTASIRASRSGATVTFEVDTGSGFTQLGTTHAAFSNTLYNSAADLTVGAQNAGAASLPHCKMGGARVWNTATPDTSDPVLDIDFRTVAHATSSFTCTTGQTVTVHSTGDNPAKVIATPCVRFDGATDFLLGGFAAAVVGARAFVVFDVLGSGGETDGRVFSVSDGTNLDDAVGGAVFSAQEGVTGNLSALVPGGGWNPNVSGGFSGRVLHEVYLDDADQHAIKNGGTPVISALSAANLSFLKYALGGQSDGGASNAAVDLLYVALFPLSMSDVDAARITSYLNARFRVY